MRELTLEEAKLVSGGDDERRLPPVPVRGTRPPRQAPWFIQRQLDALSPIPIPVQGQQPDGLDGGDLVDPNALTAAQQAIINGLEEQFGEHLDFQFDGNTLQIIATTDGWIDISINGVRDGIFDPDKQGEKHYAIGAIVGQFYNANGDAIGDMISRAGAADLAEHYIPFTNFGS